MILLRDDNGKQIRFITEIEYPEFVRQEMIVNSACHRDYSITGTDIQIKLFDDRLVVESLGNLPGLVRPDNIRHTHFSRNPRIAHYLKAYTYVKEFGEGVDRMCREMEAEGMQPIKYYKNDFMLRAVAWNKVAISSGNEEKSSGKSDGNAKSSGNGVKSSGKSSGNVGKSVGNLAITWEEVRTKCKKNTVIILEYLNQNGSITNTKAREKLQDCLHRTYERY